jgi:UDP-N-acetylglucosamine:LPS N-acetylglucosamine transferase
VVAHAGLGAVSDIAAAGRPAVVMPQGRPHNEQHSTAEALQAAGLAVVPHAEPGDQAWPDLLEQADRLDAHRWRQWSDGTGALRAATVIGDTARLS